MPKKEFAVLGYSYQEPVDRSAPPYAIARGVSASFVLKGMVRAAVTAAVGEPRNGVMSGHLSNPLIVEHFTYGIDRETAERIGQGILLGLELYKSCAEAQNGEEMPLLIFSPSLDDIKFIAG